MPDKYTPKLGDSWVIQIRRPAKYPREIIFENRFGGLITIRYPNEKPRVIGTVLRPVWALAVSSAPIFRALDACAPITMA